MPGDHVLGVGMGMTELMYTAIDKGRSVEMLQTKKNAAEHDRLATVAERAFRIAFTKGMFQVLRACSLLCPQTRLLECLFFGPFFRNSVATPSRGCPCVSMSDIRFQLFFIIPITTN